MSQQSHITAQRLLNLYRQAHVIDGGWAAVNKVLVNESNDNQVISELENLPTGKKLIEHIKNLRDKKTPMNSIDKDLLPYGGLMLGIESNMSLSPDEMKELEIVLNNFQPTIENLSAIKKMPLIKKFGNSWTQDIKAAISHNAKLSEKWQSVIQADKAFQVWDSAHQLLSQTLTERDRSQIQASMPEFETYLPMFGDSGQKMLNRLRTFVSSAK